eukprot:2800605-Rhodomonas_salina.3
MAALVLTERVILRHGHPNPASSLRDVSMPATAKTADASPQVLLPTKKSCSTEANCSPKRPALLFLSPVLPPVLTARRLCVRSGPHNLSVLQNPPPPLSAPAFQNQLLGLLAASGELRSFPLAIFGPDAAHFAFSLCASQY